jgi:hypothetical protein
MRRASTSPGRSTQAAAALLGDEVRVRQIVTNLVGNAIKFTDTGGVLVTVGRCRTGSASRRRGRVCVAITVEDTGIGIAEEALPFLFFEFEQADAAVRRRQGGTGLGLAISRPSRAGHVGRYPCDQQAGCGSKFTGRAALKRAASLQARSAKAPALPAARAAGARPADRAARGCACRWRAPAFPVKEWPSRRRGRVDARATAAGEPSRPCWSTAMAVGPARGCWITRARGRTGPAGQVSSCSTRRPRPTSPTSARRVSMPISFGRCARSPC